MNRGNARTTPSRCRNTLFQVDTVSTRQGGIKGHNIKNIEISGKQPNPHQLFFQAYRSKYLLQTLIPFIKGTHEEAHTSTSTQERLFSHFLQTFTHTAIPAILIPCPILQNLTHTTRVLCPWPFHPERYKKRATCPGHPLCDSS